MNRTARRSIPIVPAHVAAALLCASIGAAASAQTITKLPMLHTVRTHEMRLQWETDSDPAGAAHAVDWGVSSVGENSTSSFETLEIDLNHFVHRATISGLEPETQYVYRVRSGSAQSGEFRFRTAPGPAAPFKVAWMADSQSAIGFADALDLVLPHGVDFIGHAGDTLNQGDSVQQWHNIWYLPLANAGNLGQTTPILVARGNHDGESPMAYAYLWLPGNGSYYAETVGRVRLIFLDTNLKSPAQTLWLEEELASTAAQTADFLVVSFHMLPFTNLWCNDGGYNGDAWVRENWVPLFEDYGVDLVVNGHAHAYERGTLNGVVYTVVGGAGGGLDTFTPPSTWSFIEVALAVHHYVIMEVDGRTLTWTAYDLTDAVIDSFQLSSASPIPAVPLWGVLGLGLGLLLMLGIRFRPRPWAAEQRRRSATR